MEGTDILRLAGRHLGEEYILGARALLSNPHHTGPWDCAEYTSWLAYQAYGIVFGTYGSDPTTADAYSGKWYEDAKDAGTLIPVEDALATPGAFVVRKPGAFDTQIGHVALCIGDGRLYEARSRSQGVVISTDAATRNWSAGVQLPGVAYTRGAVAPYTPPEGLIKLAHPFLRGQEVLTVQCALEQAGFSTKGVDGIYGKNTQAAVINFQLVRGLTVDGEVGQETARALELGWPIDTGLASTLCAGLLPEEDMAEDEVALEDDLRGLPMDESLGTTTADTANIQIEDDGRDRWARVDGQRFFVGTKVKYGAYYGLYQKIGDLPKLGGGTFDPNEAAAQIGNWAHVLNPTIQGESSGYFGRLNTYDRARFTFGCFQMAAHTAGDNLILYMRALLELPEAGRYFPDLILRGGKVHKIEGGTVTSLEREEYSTKYKETQLPDFMAYLNPTLGDVEHEEALAAARLMLWTSESEAARVLQLEMAQQTISKKIGWANSSGLNIMALPTPLAIWCMDLRHQGRARISQINAALKKSNPYEALKWAGLSHKHESRVETVDRAIQALMAAKPNWETMSLEEVVG